ncbi:hypothetical protein B0T26DRAFT_703571 [Lasiosphaeria miniovina]|uniref:Uncharacterized protein n=1 Tax=Lasiosphaeria miniovina TaxID=1954250 RepID=A0AA40E2L7_9PEZI|nr:uncharacterized protein B0T26DRAFT_703571 [Lasiosphaeria miniovina]KAK0722677.1 hypothetical protein B0T26DRAFT_703571 [Lasiosphaeria miniovina]
MAEKKKQPTWRDVWTPSLAADFGSGTGSAIWGGNARPSLQSLQNFFLPNHDAVDVRYEDLFDADDGKINTEFDTGNFEAESFVELNYARVWHGEIEFDTDPTVQYVGDRERWRHGLLMEGHNGLGGCRRHETLVDEALFTFANRLILNINKVAKILPIGAAGNYFILPIAYMLKQPWPGEVPKPQHRDHMVVPLLNTNIEESTLGPLFSLEKRFNDALFTLHIVHFYCGVNSKHKKKGVELAHYALIIRQRNTGDTFYLDSISEGRPQRGDVAKMMLDKLLEDSGIPANNDRHHRVIAVWPQHDEVSCGLHVIANMIAFLEMGVLGWDRIPRWQDKRGHGDPVKMIRQLTTSLHYIWGLKRSGFDKINLGPRPEEWQMEDTPSDLPKESEAAITVREARKEATEKEDAVREVEEALKASSKTKSKSKTGNKRKREDDPAPDEDDKDGGNPDDPKDNPKNQPKPRGRLKKSPKTAAATKTATKAAPKAAPQAAAAPTRSNAGREVKKQINYKS